MLPWDDLKYVLAMSRHGNATAAGRSLGVNATTVSRRIRALEEHLDTRLFDRQPNGSVPTAAGEAALRVAAVIEEEVHGLDAEIRGLDRELRGDLRVTSMDIVFEFWRKDLAEFQEKYPGVSLTLASTNRPVDLSRREADIAIRFAVAPPEHLVGRRFVELFFATYASKELAETHGSDLSAYPWIGWDRPFAEATDRVIRRYAPNASVPLRISSLSQLGRSIQDGVGVSVLPCFFGDDLPGAVRVGDYYEGGTYLWALTHDQLRRSARVRAFMDILASWVERDRARFAGKSVDEIRPPVASRAS
ncbi:MAG: LysR family transcriptional regulator [Myxococcota bacterium]